MQRIDRHLRHLVGRGQQDRPRAIAGDRSVQLGNGLRIEGIAALRPAELHVRAPGVITSPNPLHGQTLW